MDRRASTNSNGLMEMHRRTRLCLMRRSLLESLSLLLLTMSPVLLFLLYLNFTRSFSLSLCSAWLSGRLTKAWQRKLLRRRFWALRLSG